MDYNNNLEYLRATMAW